ncbi:hypothetical protein RUM43_012868, partial [Polyplax serrata]
PVITDNKKGVDVRIKVRKKRLSCHHKIPLSATNSVSIKAGVFQGVSLEYKELTFRKIDSFVIEVLLYPQKV